MPPLPHFNISKLQVSNSNPVFTNNYEVRFYDHLGREFENLNCPSFNLIENDRMNKSIKATLHSSTDFIVEYETLLKVKYIFFVIYNKNYEALKRKIFDVDLLGVQCKFNYYEDSIQENDCDFSIHNFYDIDNIDNYDEAVKTIIRGDKLKEILD